MLYRVTSGRLAAGTTCRGDAPPAALAVDLQEDFDSPYPARLLLLELAELSPVLLSETDADWYVGAPEDDGHCQAIWLEEHESTGDCGGRR